MQEALMGVSFSVEGLTSPEEIAVAWRAVERYRQEQTKSPGHISNPPSGELDGGTAALASRIFKGFTWRPLGPAYAEIFRELLGAPDGRGVKIEDFVAKLNATADEMKARLSKLSGRMKRIATPEELARVRTPFMLFADIEYDGKSSQYRLTPAGREAAKRYLGQ
jgi:hypothetical protein